MKTTLKSKISPARKHVEHAWNSVPRSSSDQRRTNVTYSALCDAISGGMHFGENDFAIIKKRIGLVAILGTETRQRLERLYALACGKERASANSTAVAALEKYLKREPFLWAERARTPERLYVGSELTWEGVRVKVTSFSADGSSLSACQYGEYEAWNKEMPSVGDVNYFCNHDRRIEAIADLGDGSMAIRFSGPIPESRDERRKIVKRFTITREQLNEARADFDKRRRMHEKAFAACSTLEQVEVRRAEVAALGREVWRHFDIEILQAALEAAKERIKAAMSESESRAYELEQERIQNAARAAELDRWVAGEDERNYFYGRSDVRVRVKGDFVETSNGHKVTIKAARFTLAFVNRHRDKGWQANGEVYDVDAFPLRSVSKEGVQIGCTLISWDEVDRCAKMLEAKP
jgi:hypothetical protein